MIHDIFSWLAIFSFALLFCYCVYFVANGDYRKLLPALCCLSSVGLELSWLLYPETLLLRNIAWNVTAIGINLALFVAYWDSR